MKGWSAWSEPFDVPAGPLDLYHSLQHLAPGARVGAHTHDGPENGYVIAGTVSRWEAQFGERRLESGASFVTPAHQIHATGNAGVTDAEQITLHVIARGAVFAQPCSDAAFPAPAPGSTSRVRVYFAADELGPRLRARHAFIVFEDECTLPASPAELFLSVAAGSILLDGGWVKAGEGRQLHGRRAALRLRGSASVVATEIENSLRS